MSGPIGFGVLGCGRITRRGILPGIAGAPDAKLVALASLRPGVAEALAAECGGPAVYASYEAVLADPQVQAVYIPTSGETHREWTLRAARAGKHVLCEKPLATSVAEAEEMVAACREARVILQEAFMWRHHPRTRRVKELLADGAIGELRVICAHFSFDIDRNDWRLDPARGGGALWDIGCYGVNAARHFTGEEPETIFARARLWTTGVDMTTQVALRFPSGVLANIDCSFEAPFRSELELVGTTGTLALPDAFVPPPEAQLLIRRGVDRETRDSVEPVSFGPVNQYAEQVTDFCRSIRAGQLLPPAENGLANMRVLSAALKQALG